MQRLEVSCAVRLIYTSLGAKWLSTQLQTIFSSRFFFLVQLAVLASITAVLYNHANLCHISLLKDYVNEKLQWHYRESNQRPSGL